MDHVAALAEASEIAEPVVRRIVIKVGRGKDDPGRPHANHLLEVRPAGASTPPVPPGLPIWIEPSSVRERAHRGPVRATAVLTNPAGTLEAHPLAEFPPVRWIQVAKIGRIGMTARCS